MGIYQNSIHKSSTCKNNEPTNTHIDRPKNKSLLILNLTALLIKIFFSIS